MPFASRKLPLAMLLGACLLSPLLAAQQAAGEPLIFRDAANPPPDHVLAETVQHLHKQLRDIAESDMTAVEKRQRLTQLMRENPEAFREGGLDMEDDQAFDAVVLQMETLFFQVAADDAPTPAGKQQVLEKAPAELELGGEKPALIEPVDNATEIRFIKEGPAEPQPPPAKPDQPAPAPAKPAAHPRESLTAQAGDPTAPLIQAQFLYFYSDVIRNSSDDAQQFSMQPLIPIPPTKLIPMTQIIRPNVPWLQEPDGKSGLGDINIEHIFVPEHHDWGTLGFGYTATLPSADHRDLGTGKYQAGPALTVVYYRLKNWQLGGTLTQSWSIAGAGNGDRDEVSQLTFQPIANYLMGRWYIGIGDFTWVYDWKGHQGWNIPLGFQVGRITKIGKYNYNLSAEVLWASKDDGGGPTPKRGIKLGFVWLLPE